MLKEHEFKNVEWAALRQTLDLGWIRGLQRGLPAPLFKKSTKGQFHERFVHASNFHNFGGDLQGTRPGLLSGPGLI